MLETVPQYRNKAIRIAGVVEGRAEFPHGVDLVDILKPCPLFGLGLPDKGNQRINIQPQFRVIGIASPDIAAGGRQKRGFDIRLKALFVGRVNRHGVLLPLPVSYSSRSSSPYRCSSSACNAAKADR